MDTVIKTNKLCKSFSIGGKQNHVLRNLDLEIERGVFTVIMGSSGSGKSTLLYAVSGMDKPTLGEVWFNGKNIATLSGDELAVFRRKNCGFVFQQIHLMENMSVMDNILASGFLLTNDKKALTKRGSELFKRVMLDEEHWGKFPSQISGGEAQRVGIVRALINNPDVLFADEPTGALNSAAGTAVLDVLSEVNNGGQSIVMVTHDLKSALRGEKIIYLQDGAVQRELLFSKYTGGDISVRSEKLRKFLASAGW